MRSRTTNNPIYKGAAIVTVLSLLAIPAIGCGNGRVKQIDQNKLGVEEVDSSVKSVEEMPIDWNKGKVVQEDYSMSSIEKVNISKEELKRLREAHIKETGGTGITQISFDKDVYSGGDTVTVDTGYFVKDGDDKEHLIGFDMLTGGERYSYGKTIKIKGDNKIRIKLVLPPQPNEQNQFFMVRVYDYSTLTPKNLNASADNDEIRELTSWGGWFRFNNNDKKTISDIK